MEHFLVGERYDLALAAIVEAERRGLDRDMALAMGEHVLERLGAGGAGDAAVEALLDAWPEWPVRGLVLARRSHALGHVQTALEQVDVALAGAPDWTAAQIERARLLRDDGRFAPALEVAEKVLQANPEDFEARRVKADVLVRLERTEKAEGILRELVRDASDDAWSHAALGELLRRTQRPDEALPLLERAESLTPTPYVVGTLGQVLLELGRPRDGRAALLRAFEEDPGELWIAGSLAGALGDEYRDLEAVAVWEHAAPVDDGDAVYVAIETATLHTLLGEFEEVGQIATRLIDGGAERNATVRSLRGWARQNTGDFAGAEADFGVAHEVDPNDLWAQKGVADCVAALTRPNGAKPQFERILQQLEQARSGLETTTHAPPPEASADEIALGAWCLYQLERYPEAIRTFQRALSMEGLAAHAQFDLALVTLCSGDERQAASEYQRGLDLARSLHLRAASSIRVALNDLATATGPLARIQFSAVTDRVSGSLERALDEIRDAIAVERQRLARSDNLLQDEPQDKKANVRRRRLGFSEALERLDATAMAEALAPDAKVALGLDVDLATNRSDAHAVFALLANELSPISVRREIVEGDHAVVLAHAFSGSEPADLLAYVRIASDGQIGKLGLFITPVAALERVTALCVDAPPVR